VRVGASCLRCYARGGVGVAGEKIECAIGGIPFAEANPTEMRRDGNCGAPRLWIL